VVQEVGFEAMMDSLRRSLEAVPEHRTGHNIRYQIADAGLGAFSVFYMQSPSFLAHQRQMQQRHGRNNARSLFGVEAIPSDGQIRNLLDPVDPSHLYAAFWQIYDRLEADGYLDNYQGVGGTLLCSLDGTQYFASQKVHCPYCTTRMREGESLYSHLVLAAVLVAPGQKRVIALDPEFITPQDGHDKQDCEQQAIKRWVRRHARRFGPGQVTILTDDLHSHQPLCELLLNQQWHFIMSCKEESHPALYQEVALLSALEGAIQEMRVRHWNGRYHEQRTYRWVQQVPVRAGAEALAVNWCEISITAEDTGRQIYHNAWITSHELNERTVVQVAEAGRAHWKVENENFNVLKNQGYHFEHNYGHGQQYLSKVLLTLLLVAFLFHTVLYLCCQRYRAVRDELSVRRIFFNDLRALTRYLYFPSWEELLTFMYQQLELAPE
jgi:hypothetical protein